MEHFFNGRKTLLIIKEYVNCREIHNLKWRYLIPQQYLRKELRKDVRYYVHCG